MVKIAIIASPKKYALNFSKRAKNRILRFNFTRRIFWCAETHVLVWTYFPSKTLLLKNKGKIYCPNIFILFFVLGNVKFSISINLVSKVFH